MVAAAFDDDSLGPRGVGRCNFVRDVRGKAVIAVQRPCVTKRGPIGFPETKIGRGHRHRGIRVVAGVGGAHRCISACGSGNRSDYQGHQHRDRQQKTENLTLQKESLSFHCGVQGFDSPCVFLMKRSD